MVYSIRSQRLRIHRSRGRNVRRCAMSYYLPQWEERTSYGYRRIDPYTKLFEERIIFLGTPISDDVANAVMAQLLALQSMDPERDISLYINSPGGSFTAMTAIYDTMRWLKSDVQTICLGQARSEEHTSELQSRFDLVCRL